MVFNEFRFFADIRDPQAYDPIQTANRNFQKITNRTADKFAVRFSSTPTALISRIFINGHFIDLTLKIFDLFSIKSVFKVVVNKI
jgi:hypothetical protein